MSHTPNFLESADKTRIVRPKRMLLALLFVAIAIAALAYPARQILKTVNQAKTHALNGRQAILDVKTELAAGNFIEARNDFIKASSDFKKAEDAIKKIVWLRRAPIAGKQILAVENLISTGIETAKAGEQMLDVAIDIKNVFHDIENARLPLGKTTSAVTFETLSPQEKRTILARFVQEIPKLEAAKTSIDSALLYFNQIPNQGLLPVLSDAIAPIRAELPRFRDDLDRLLPLMRLVPSFAGYPNEKHTLVLFLNNAELRPGGGFLGAVGRFDISNAALNSFETKDSYAIDQPAEKFVFIEPPKPLKQYLGIKYWFMRDANWSPDFKVSAENVIDFYQKETATALSAQIDQVIGFTPTFASEILKITGPITVSGETFTSENLFDELEYQVEKGFDAKGIPYAQRKEILAELAAATIERLANLPYNRWEEILFAVDKSFNSKQLMLYSRDEKTQSFIESRNWAGRVRFSDDGKNDFFMVVDANLGSLKSDPFVKRNISYNLTPQGDQYEATVSINYKHDGVFDWKTTRYRTYTRLYAPSASEFKTASGLLRDDKIKNPKLEAGKADIAQANDIDGLADVFGAFISIEPKEERTLTFNYLLPASSIFREENGKSCYNLTVQKQLGAFTNQLTLDIGFDKTPRSAEPAEARENQFDNRYQIKTDLSQDRKFKVCF